ncbi:hypothetical protein Scep_019150 [Stephania cephalantha]|uniref:Uncharacterized protein n=1 Tax=Stephania cephalantha TaxID=152367 RepID=A0AAP0IB99_9MAGN
MSSETSSFEARVIEANGLQLAVAEYLNLHGVAKLLGTIYFVVRFGTAKRAAERKLFIKDPYNFHILSLVFNRSSRFARLQSIKCAVAGKNLYMRFSCTTRDTCGMKQRCELEILIDAEYAYSIRANEKSDIYSFDVVILDLVRGKHQIDLEYEEKDLVKWVSTTLNQEDIDHIIDPNHGSYHKEKICKWRLGTGLGTTRLDLGTFLGTFLGGEHSGALARALARATPRLGKFLGPEQGDTLPDSLGTSKVAPWHEQGRALISSLGTGMAIPWQIPLARARSCLGTSKAAPWHRQGIPWQGLTNLDLGVDQVKVRLVSFLDVSYWS